MVTPGNPLSALSLSTDNVPGSLNTLHKLFHLIITTLWTNTIIISILQMVEVSLREVELQTQYAVGL